MEDFRRVLYATYASTRRVRPHSTRTNWWQHKFGPLFADLDPDEPLLELGAGTGDFLGFLAGMGFTAVRGIDISAEQVELAGEAGAPVARADAIDFLQSSGTSYAGLICLDFLEHLTRDELVELVPFMYASLKPGGRLIGQTVNMAGLLPNQVAYGDLTHMTLFTPDSLELLLRTFGFRDIEVYEAGPIPSGFKGRLRVLIWAVIRRVAYLIKRIESGKRQRIWTDTFLFTARRPSEDHL